MIHITEKSLVEQLGLSKRELTRRLHRIDFTEADRALIRTAEPHIRADLERIVQDFYRLQLEDSEIGAIIGDIDTLKRLQNLMRGYILTLFAGNYNEDYANNRLRIGRVHKRLGVTPKLYMTAIGNLQGLLDGSLTASMGADAEAARHALHKVLMFDSQMVFEAYIDGFLIDMETAREEVERYAAAQGVQMEALTRRMHDISTKDPLTGVYNRRAFHDYLARECDVARRHKLPLTLMYMDLNGFKPVNDTHGHDAGDHVLRQVGESLLAMTRSVDVPARFGGDEFCVIMPRTTLADAVGPIQRMMADFDGRRQYPVTFSVGVVQTGPDAVMEAADLITAADGKMYEAKARARKDGAHHIAS